MQQRQRVIALMAEAKRRGLVPAMDPVDFAGLLGYGELDPWQAAALRDNSARMILNCSRQAGKSTVASIKAVYRSIYKPGLSLLISPSERQSAELFRKVKDGFGALPELMRPEFVEDNKLSCELKNGARIISLPSSEKTVRGFSAVDLLIEDEASRVDDVLYKTIRPMLAVSGGSLIMMSTPFGKLGHYYEEWQNGSENWKRIEVLATEIPRISKEFLEEERKSLGELWYSQEYMCKFVDPVDSIFSTDDIERAFGHSDIEVLFQTTDQEEEVELLSL